MRDTGQKEKRDQRKYGYRFIVCVVIAISLTGCVGNSAGLGNGGSQPPVTENDTQQERVDTGLVVTGPESYDSADTCILVEKNTADATVTFLNLKVSKRYTLSVDGTTHFYDRYGESISLEQVKKGAIVDITFLKSKKHLTSLQLSPSAWDYENVQNYEMNMVRNEVTIGAETYKISQNTQYYSAGRNIDSMDLNVTDTLSFQGIDSEILTVTVEKGHGYLRLANDENFVGGWIEIGQSQIQQITQDMLLVVPEGSYQVTISHKGGGGTKSVVINRNEETTLDVGDLTVAQAQYGTVLFSLTPSGASLYIDGSKEDASQPISLEYGIHQLIVKADGYQSITRYLRVGQESAGIDIVLDALDGTDEEEEEEENKDKPSSTTDSSSKSDPDVTDADKVHESDQEAHTDASESTDTNDSSDTTDAITDYYKVYIDAPEGAEVYVDGNYVGIAPCSFRKTDGSHVITLRKTGYETRSYTIQVGEEEKDLSYSFVDLLEIGAEH